MGVWYASREDVKLALGSTTTRSDARIDRAIESASRSVEGKLYRRFYPELSTRYFDWPRPNVGRAGRIWLDGFNEMASVSAVTVDNGATVLSPSAYQLRRSDEQDEAPYDLLEILRSSNAAFSGSTTGQKAVAATGVFIGCPIVEALNGSLSAAIASTSATTATVTDSSGIGVGSLLRVDSERMTVTRRNLITTGQTVATANLTATASNTSVLVASGAALNIGEDIVIDAESMRVVDIAGNMLIVERATRGSVLATHSIGATIYAPRSLTVTRGALGTTAATHLISAAVYSFVFPGPVSTLTIALAINTDAQEAAAYARTAGSGDSEREFTGRGIAALERDAIAAYGRRLRYLGGV